jgi:isopenicillin-N N-acyltransferase-like protein
MNLRNVPVVDVKGPPRDRGRQQGEGAQAQIGGMLAAYRELLPEVIKTTWEEALRESRKYMPFAEATFPNFVEELRGIAEGADVPFEHVWLLNCYEAVTRSHYLSCTSLAVRDDRTASGHVLLAHNEDWVSVDRDHVYLVHAEPEDGPAFIGMSYGPLLVNVGLNEEGIGVAINSVYATDEGVGVPRILFSRAILAATTIGEAIRACLPRHRAGGYHYLLADAHGELYGVESSATAHAVLYGDDGWLVHTNHYLSSKMQALEQPGVYSGSHVRLNRARRLLYAQMKEGKVTLDDLQTVLRDHVNYPNSICTHEDPADPPHEREQTVVSMVMDLTERVMWAALGPPCEGEYALVRL